MAEKMDENGDAPVEDSTEGKNSLRANESADIKDEGLANDSVKIKSSSQANDNAQLNDSSRTNNSALTNDTKSVEIDDIETTAIHISPANVPKTTSGTPDFNLIVTGVGTAISAHVVYHEAEAMSDMFCVFLSVGPRSSPQVALHELLRFIMMLCNRQTLRRHKDSRMHCWGDFHCYSEAAREVCERSIGGNLCLEREVCQVLKDSGFP
ncbi:hypothetical protein Tdes44962_MAKER00284 [Teratosphaeria destructans]|uniref:Uncharacterized protein n=1 Tax=Teratosphaeria destructans TaxID=418781 RepID=A0A9W7W4G0_9PEZI|nr:hypothetical protein Tdes44962_MAKER00284 [Teratosphaeria destructans]